MTSPLSLRQALKIPGPRAVAAALLALLTLAVYWPLTEAGFVNLDDPTYVTANEQVLGGLRAEGLRWALTALRSGNWHPLTWASHMLDVALFGTSAGAHHTVSLLIHVANALLLFLLFDLLTGAAWRSAFIAALFAVHPQHVESVAWVAERKDVLSTLFGLLAILAYLRQLRAPGGGRWALTAGCFALSLLSKPMLVTLPFALLLLDFWPLARFAGDSRRHSPLLQILPSLVMEKIPLFALAAAATLTAFIAQGRAQSLTSLERLGWSERLANAILSYGAYLGKTFWPLGLTVHYPYADGDSISLVALAIAAAVLLSVTAAAVLLRHSSPFLATGWCWYLGTLIPVIGLVQIGTQARADRYTYLPLVGIFLVVTWGAASLLAGRGARLPALAALALLPLSIAVRAQVGYWHDDSTLFGHALEIHPGDTLALKNYGYGLAVLGRVEEGEALMRQAHDRDPALKAELFLKTATLREREGKIEEAAAYYREALRLDPADGRAQRDLDRLRRTHPERAAGPAAAARPSYHDTAPALTASEAFSRGNALAAAKRYAEAVEAYREAIGLQPAFPEAWNNLGGAYGDLGLRAESIAAFREALRLRPEFREARENLERALAAPPDRR